jgi:hypothetical protein
MLKKIYRKKILRAIRRKEISPRKAVDIDRMIGQILDRRRQQQTSLLVFFESTNFNHPVNSLKSYKKLSLHKKHYGKIFCLTLYRATLLLISNKRRNPLPSPFQGETTSESSSLFTARKRMGFICVYAKVTATT